MGTGIDKPAFYIRRPHLCMDAERLHPTQVDIRNRYKNARPCAPPNGWYRLKQDEFSRVRGCPGFARRGLSDRKENGTAKHAKHAKGGGVLQARADVFGQ
jgi:hypothetical protein